MDFVTSHSVAIEKGKKLYTSLEIGEMPNGYPVTMPVMTVSGTTDGPTFYVNACMHGDEILGSDVLRRVVYSLDQNEMAGTLIAVPMSNPIAVATRTRRNVVEMYPGPHDMNRIFPAPADGVMTERIAALLGSDFIEPADYAFDLHCASVGGAWHPYSGYPSESSCATQEVYDKSTALARAFGAPNLLGERLFHGSLVDFAVRAGTAASMAEFGVANLIDSNEREFGMRGVLNLLKVTSMIPGEPELPSEQALLKKIHRMRTDGSGYLVHDVPLGSDITAGTRVAHIENLAGSVAASFEAPADGRVCRINTMGVVGTGDIVCYVAELG